MDMIVNLSKTTGGLTFALSGTCPHCDCRSVFTAVQMPHVEDIHNPMGGVSGCRLWAILQCQGCAEYILGGIESDTSRPASPTSKYVAHYPLDKPKNEVAHEIPDPIAGDFQEALRCRWINANRATILMCRRALQVSCDREGALGNDLFKQIDDLASKQRITETLRQMAHRIRLLGKKGAHGDYSDIDATVTDKDADDALTFMRHYLDFVYVLPEKLKP